jgi:hypothetical protein
MPGFGRGRGGGFGRGGGLSRGYWAGAGFGRGRGMGWGMGNPYPHCRFYPWMPRRWWAMGMNPYATGPYAQGVVESPGPYVFSPWPGPVSE